jgi:hypothetical protein
MSTLFTSFRVGALELANRLVIAPMWCGNSNQPRERGGQVRNLGEWRAFGHGASGVSDPQNFGVPPTPQLGRHLSHYLVTFSHFDTRSSLSKRSGGPVGEAGARGHAARTGRARVR